METYLIPCLLGLEKLVSDEVKRLGLQEVQAENGRILCRGTLADAARLNLNLRCGARVLLVLGRFPARSFEELFQGTRAIAWEDYLPENAAFPVKGYSISSQLHSVPACQSIIKKAMVERMKAHYHREQFPEDGVKYQVRFSLFKDEAALCLDTSGEGLYKRGYRAVGVEAPLRETLAAAMVLLSRYRGKDPLCDPFCGSGTIPIEAALIAKNRAPGLDRSRVVFSAIHTHNSTMFTKNTTYEVYFKSVLGDLCPEMEEPDDILKDEELEEFFIGKMVDLIEEAWAARRPGGVALAHEYAAVAFNRRPQFLVNGKRESKMYGDCSEPNFLGYEGPSDHSADMLYTFDEQRQLTGALVCIPCPSQVYELHRFISADYWGEVRTQLRAELGNIFVLPLCGAAGDQNPLDLVRISKDNKRELIVWNAQETEVDRSFDMLRECQQIGGRICDAVLRGYRQARNEIQTRPVFRTNCFEMDVPLRTVEKADVDAAGARIEAVKAACPAGERLTEAQMIRCFEDIGYLNRWKLQQETTRFTFPIFVFRIGAAAFATNPFELYVDYSYRMKARCKARQAFIIQLSSNAKGGYLPTQIAVDGGSYGSKPVSTMVGPEGGDELVEKTIAAMDALF